MVLAVVLVVFIIPWPLLITPNYRSFGYVLTYWLVAGLASLITLLAMKIFRRQGKGFSTQEALQQIQVRG